MEPSGGASAPTSPMSHLSRPDSRMSSGDGDEEGRHLERFLARYKEQCKTVGKARTLLLTEEHFAEHKIDASLNLRCNVKYVLYSYYYVYPMSFLRSLVLKGVDIKAKDLSLVLNSANMKKLVNLDVSDNFFLGTEGGDLCVLLAKEVKSLCFLDVTGSNVPTRQAKDVALLCFENFLRGNIFYDEVTWLESIYFATKKKTWESLVISAEVYDAIELGDMNAVFHRRWRSYAQKHYKRRSITPTGIMEALHGEFHVSLEEFVAAALPPCSAALHVNLQNPPEGLFTFRELVSRWPVAKQTVALAGSGYIPPPAPQPDDDDDPVAYPANPNFPLSWFHAQMNLSRMTMATLFLPALPTAAR
eukprot:TRINITY_DN10396_c0_g1_i1.p1 TRINITY_DN10396_c0_g1~~TRINITY_DN10396_c0_g1_i1.p1  ORF type:complete len:360 (+),score=139.37 TRINITY_DN10396_c0_g1_i1:85-1164(+)